MMNIVWLVAGSLVLLASFIHAFVGDKEFQVLKPETDRPAKYGETWIQSRSGWHWVSVDLVLVGILLITMSITSFINAETEIAILLCIYFLCCGMVWLATVFFSGMGISQVFRLGQWIFCFLVSGLIFLGL